MSNRYLDALGRPPRPGKERKPKPHPSHVRSRKQERETAVRLGARLTAASGAKDVKGDVRKRRVARIECKTTKNKSFPVTLELLRKIEDQALASDEAPVLLVEFNDGFGRRLGELAVIPSYLLEDFCETKK